MKTAEQKFCAHRGVSALMPENTLPAFAAALALGADEIELDVRLAKDGVLVVSHDGTLDRISDGRGNLSDYTFEELKKLNIGLKHGWDVSFCTVEEVFALLANRIVFNLHIKEIGEDGYVIRKLSEIIARYHAEKSVYFAFAVRDVKQPERFEQLAPQIERTMIQLRGDTESIIDLAERYHCTRVQFWLGMFDETTIRTLHEKGIRCNLFYADTMEDYDRYFAMGIDTLLTNRMDLAARYTKKG